MESLLLGALSYYGKNIPTKNENNNEIDLINLKMIISSLT